MAATRITNLQIPANWMDYIQKVSTDMSPLVTAGVLVPDAQIAAKMAGGNSLINMPHYRDLADAAENVSTDDPASAATPTNITTGLEIGVRLSRNQVFSSMDLNVALAGSDPMIAIESLTSGYWAKRAQAALIATAGGVFLNNDEGSPGGGAVQGDMTNDVSGVGFTDNVTNFTPGGFIDATHTMGDAQKDLGVLFVHPTVHARMLKADLIDFRPDSEGRMSIEFYQGRAVIVSRGMPNPSTGIYHSWIFAANAFGWGIGSAKVPAETSREATQGNGGGQDILTQRVEWVIHPRGMQWTAASTANGGPSNATTTNNLGHADSWVRAVAERALVPMARYITREFA